jgi:hypothetical protein
VEHRVRVDVRPPEVRPTCRAVVERILPRGHGTASTTLLLSASAAAHRSAHFDCSDPSTPTTSRRRCTCPAMLTVLPTAGSIRAYPSG